MRLFRSLSLLSLFSAAVAAHATVLDFEGIAGTSGPFYTNHGTAVTQSGYVVSEPGGLGSWNSTSYSATGYAFYTGTTALYGQGNAEKITLSRSDGGSFDLTSMDVATVWVHSFSTATSSILFTGMRADGSTVTSTYVTEPDDALHTVAFPGFTNLTSVAWNQDLPFHQFDNVNVSASVQATPEPASLTALVVGAAALLRRRKTSQSTLGC